MPSCITRFAPSPTGTLHLGHAYAAGFAWTEARKNDGRFLLRWEDIDSSRCRSEYEKEILEELEWLGFLPDSVPMRQSTRLPIYSAALARLAATELTYPCFCTRKSIQQEVARSHAAPHGPEGIPYPGTCRRLDPAIAMNRIAEGESHAIRLRVDEALRRVNTLHWFDRRQGKQFLNPLPFGDIVLARKEVPTSYHLAVTLDDAAQEITLVTRGEDLFEATHIHRLLQALLDLPVPEWHHHRLITDEQGHRLATRNQAVTLREYRKKGATAEEIKTGLGLQSE